MNNPRLLNSQNALVKYQYTYYGSPPPESCPLPPATWGQKTNEASLVSRECRIIVESLINQQVNFLQNAQNNGQFNMQDYNEIISKLLLEFYNYQCSKRNSLKNYGNLDFNQNDQDVLNNYVYGFNERTQNYWNKYDEMNYQNKNLHYNTNDRMYRYDGNTMDKNGYYDAYGRKDGYNWNNAERNINYNAYNALTYKRNNIDNYTNYGYNGNGMQRNGNYNIYDGYENNSNQQFGNHFNGEGRNYNVLNNRYGNGYNRYENYNKNVGYSNNYIWDMNSQNRKEWKRGYNNFNNFNRKRSKRRNKKNKLCSKCNKQFNTHSKLRMHERTHRTPSPFLIAQTEVQKSNDCDNIKKEVSSCNSFQFMNGGPSSHSTPRDLELSNDEKMFKCPHCPKSFAKSSEMSRHLQVHTPGIEYSCKICSLVYFTETQLKFHELIHSQDQNNIPNAVN